MNNVEEKCVIKVIQDKNISLIKKREVLKMLKEIENLFNKKISKKTNRRKNYIVRDIYISHKIQLKKDILRKIYR